jgi:hypothetical protein
MSKLTIDDGRDNQEVTGVTAKGRGGRVQLRFTLLLTAKSC